MSSNEQIASWFRKSRKKSTRLQLVHQAGDGSAERLVWEWTVDDLPSSFVECAAVVTEAAQTATNTAQENQSYVLRTLDDNGSVLANLILETEADVMMTGNPENPAAFMTVAMGQVLQHKNKDQAQQHTATQAALRVVLETNKELMHDRQKTNALLFDLLGKVFELRMAEIKPTEEGDVMKEAWAVSLDKATDGLVTHLMPAIGKVLDEGTRKLLEEHLPSKGGRPSEPGSRRQRRKKAQNGAKQNEQA